MVVPTDVGDDAAVRAFLRAAFRHGLSLYRVVYVNAAHADADIDERDFHQLIQAGEDTTHDG